MSWPTGREVIVDLLAKNELEQVLGDLEGAATLLSTAARHIETAVSVASSDPEGAYAVLYDAARKSLNAVLLAQGLRSTSKGGHLATERAIQAQFTKPPPAEAFRAFPRLRVTRNSSEYRSSGAVDTALVVADVVLVRRLHGAAAQLVQAMPVFVG